MGRKAKWKEGGVFAGPLRQTTLRCLRFLRQEESGPCGRLDLTSAAVLAQESVDNGQEVRLAAVVCARLGDASVQAAVFLRGEGKRAQDDRGDIPVLGCRLEVFGEREPIHDRHHEVDDDQRRDVV